jgi:hypothetical protein
MSKQEEIKQALAALKPSTELYMVWDQQDGLMCITEYDKAAQEYEEQLEAVKDVVSSYGSEENERVVFARIEKQAYVSIYETDEHSDLTACWNEYERDDVENAELVRLRNELEVKDGSIEVLTKQITDEVAISAAVIIERNRLRKALSDVHNALRWGDAENALDKVESIIEQVLGQEGEGNQ